MVGPLFADPATGVLIVQTGAGTHRSGDHGATWSLASGGLGQRPASSFDTVVSGGGVMYSIGAACSMLFRSIDAGLQWTPTGFDGPDCIDSIALTAGPAPRLLISVRDGPLLASSDGGRTFAEIGSGLPPGARLGSMKASPSTPGLVVAMVSGTGTTSVYRSVDSGDSWAPATLVPNSFQFPTSRFSFGAGGRIYLAGLDFFRSEDGGAVWFQVEPSRSAVAAHPTEPDTVYFVGSNGHLKRSAIGGPWAEDISAGQLMANETDPAQIVDIAIRPTGSGDDLLVTTELNGVFRRVNGVWTSSNSGLRAVNVRAMVGHPVAAGAVLAGVADGFSATQGMYRSADGGASWSPSAAGLRAMSVRSLTIDPTTVASPDSTVVYATGQGSRVSNAYANAGLWKSLDGGSSWNTIQSGIPSGAQGPSLGLVRALALDRRSCTNPPPAPAPCVDGPLSTLYATSDGVGTVETFRIIKSMDGGSQWSDVDGLPQRISANGATQWIKALPIVVDPHDSARVYVGSYATVTGGTATIANGVFRSVDGGETWNLQSEGLPLLAGSAQTHFDVYALAIDPQVPGLLWASTIQTGVAGVPSRIFRTTDGGKLWVPSIDGITGGDIRQLVVDPATPGTLYAAASASTTGPAGVYRSRDGGVTWRSISVGLHHRGALGLTIDPLDPARLFAGTAAGVFILDQRVDTDLDGIPDAIEAAGPNGGDGNADEIADAQQAHVATFERSSGSARWRREGTSSAAGVGEYITVAVEPAAPDTCAQLVDVQDVSADQRPADGADSARFVHVLPLVRLEILDCPSASVVVTHHGTAADAAARMRFHGPSQPGVDDPRWRAFDDRATRLDAQSWRLQLDLGAFGSYRPDAAGSILFEGGVGSDRLFADGFD